MQEVVHINPSGGLAISPGKTWQPVVGSEYLRYKANIPKEARDRVQSEATEILARGIQPGQAAVSAGLVVGYVQSGKTMSFTAVTALARDNGFALVVVVAGTSIKLLDQTRERLASDLELDDKAAHRRWVHVASPKPDSEEATRMSAALEDWLDPQVDPAERATVLITTMKQHRHLDWLSQVLDGIGKHLDLSQLSALIIDDEADQASPNVNRRPGEESATYGRIRRIRAALPSHSLLEYTATPQATLLVSLVDELSPDYVCVLEPGDGYTGGQYFFQENRDWFIRHIPPEDVLAIDEETGPPETLQKAFALFVLGAAVGLSSSDEPSQRSMLVHPSQKTLPQGRFVDWLKAIRDLWADLLKEPPGNSDREDLVRTWLEPGYIDLQSSDSALPPFESLLEKLPRLLRRTSLEEVNAARGSSQPINWGAGYSWVLVGGQLLDRGFTVEGLTVTYMPRGLGVGNADTVQQRARFFGYKGEYAHLCRAWLDPEVDSAFSQYVEHEEAMRKELREVAASGESLKAWKRTFLLARRMKLTRASVVRLDMARAQFAAKWFDQSDFDGADEGIFAANREIAIKFVSSLLLGDDPGDERRDVNQIHPFADVALGEVLESLLQGFIMTGEDAIDFASLRVLLAVADDQGEETCRVHVMAQHAVEIRRRSVDDYGRIKNLFQGSNSKTGYPGDRSIRHMDQVSVQIHNLNLDEESGALIGTQVPVLAVWVPERLDTSVIVQRLA